jgi:ankyrin repeat protein
MAKNQEDVEELLRQGDSQFVSSAPANTTIADTAIYDAARDGDLEKVRTLLKNDPNLVFSKNSDGWTPLHFAAAFGHKDMVELLLANKADVSAKNNGDWTPLRYAVENGHTDVAELLRLQGGQLVFAASTNTRITDTISADIPPKANFPAVPADQTALAKAKTTEQKNTTTYATINDAVLDGNLERVMEFLKNNPKLVSVKDTKYGVTPLHIAAALGHKDVAELLISKGANVNATDNNNYSPLHYAIANGHKEVADLLRQLGGRE